MNYEELIKNLKTISNKQEQVDYLFDYLLNVFEYDYIYLELVHLMKIDHDNPEFFKYLCYTNLFDDETREDTIKLFNQKTTISENMLNFLRSGEWKSRSISGKEIKYLNDILIKGVCEDFSLFIKKVLNKVGVDCVVQHGKTPYSHAWNVIRINDEWLNYDITYAIYSRDEYKGWNEKTEPQDWLGITDEQLLALHPTRVINPPKNNVENNICCN